MDYYANIFIHAIMDYIGSKDYLEIAGASVISNVDFDVVSRLYQPLIGYKAAMLYFTLVNYMNNNEGELYTHDYLFSIMQIESSDFLKARKVLEASGLIKTYLKNEGDIKKYTYVIYSPKSPKDFFNDVLFKGLLVRYIGEKNAIKLALQYKCNISVKDARDVSSNFVDIFQPDLNDGCFDTKMPINLKDTKAIKVDTKFSFDDFFTHLKTAMMINSDAFSKQECDEIERVATLYGLDVITVCDIVAQVFDERKRKGAKVDLKSFAELAMNQAAFSSISRKVDQGKTYVKISGHTELADEIRLMEELSPKQYLQEKQDGVAPVTADLKILNYLSDVVGLNNQTINALVNYCLEKCDGRLSRNYIEPVASSLKRKKITSALDALNYFNNSYSKSKKSLTKSTIINQPEEKQNNEKDYDEDEYNKLIERITKGDK